MQPPAMVRKIKEAIGEATLALAASAIPPSTDGRIMCHLRSPVASECRVQKIMASAPISPGIAVRSPVCIILTPKFLTICGSQSPRL